MLELEVAQTVHHLEAVDDDELLSMGMTYLGDELEPSPASLKGRVLARLAHLDEQLGEFIPVVAREVHVRSAQYPYFHSRKA